MGSLRVGHDWVTSLSLFTSMHWRRKWQPTCVLAWRIPGTGEPGGLLSMGLQSRTRLKRLSSSSSREGSKLKGFKNYDPLWVRFSVIWRQIFMLRIITIQFLISLFPKVNGYNEWNRASRVSQFYKSSKQERRKWNLLHRFISWKLVHSYRCYAT